MSALVKTLELLHPSSYLLCHGGLLEAESELSNDLDADLEFRYKVIPLMYISLD